MASDESALFSREELVGGPSARRSTLLLFAIENRTAHLLVREPQAVPIVLSERAATERERAFLDALAQGRDLPVHPTIQDLERYAPEWADLVPEDPGTRAGVAHLLGTKYVFTDQAVPRLRSALGLDAEAVEQAYQRLYGTPLATIYAPRVRPADRLRWAASRLAGQLDALPTFWLAFVITLIIGAVNLALPIAVAGVGALPGIALIVVLGIINVVTVAAMVEVVTRSGSIRYGNAFIGTVVADYLGGASSAILTVVLTAFSFGILLIFYIGISTTLADATALPAAAWMVVLFLVGLYFLTRGSLNATVASTIVITTINVGLLLALSAFAFSAASGREPHVRQPAVEPRRLLRPAPAGGARRGRPRHLCGAHPGRHLREDAARARTQRAIRRPGPCRRHRLRDGAQCRLGAGRQRRHRARGACRADEHGAGAPGCRARPARSGAGGDLRHPQHGAGPHPVLAGALQPGPRAHR